MKVKFTSQATRDIEDLRIYLAERSYSGLTNVLSEIESYIKSTAENPSLGRRTPRDDVRERVTKKYKFLLPYHVRGDTLYILRVYRGRRKPLNYDTILNLE